MSDSVDQFRARPGQGLAPHLDGVAENARLLAPRGTTHAGDDWTTLLGVAGELHDAGKYTPAFQTYLDSDGPPTVEEYHADVGAALTMRALKSRGVSNSGTLAATLAVANHHGRLPDVKQVWKRWSNRKPNDGDSTRERHRVRGQLDGFALVDWKLSAIDESGGREPLGRRFEHVADGASWANVRDHGAGLLYRLFNRGEEPEVTVDEQFYHTLVRLWGSLVCADWSDAGGVELTSERPFPSDTRFSFDDDSETAAEARLNELRTAARETARDRIREHPDQSVFRLTLPTGFGKTAAGVAAATERARQTGGRVVYALPFTTVVDQADEVLREQFGVSPGDEAYTVHHHLAETWTGRDAENEPLSGRTARSHARAWRAGFVLTTYVQLFESLVGPTVDRAQKLAALEDAVILLDEPQAIRPAWWRAVATAVETLCDRYDATVILTTATQPRVLAECGVGEPTELAPKAEAFGFLEDNERVRFELDESVRQTVHGGGSDTETGDGDETGDSDETDHGDGTTVSVSRAGRKLVTAARREDTLAVTATVDSVGALVDAVETTADDVVNLGRQLIEWLPAAGDEPREAAVGAASVETVASDFLNWVANESAATDAAATVVVPLTAALRPVDRRVLVRALRDRLDGDRQTPLDDHSLVCVSTQVIEAGVDVSFDRVFRDFAPIPSLVQTAGRCNRSLGGDTGLVTLWQLDGDPVPSETIYGSERVNADDDRPDLLKMTRVVLSTLDPTETELSELRVIRGLVRDYYDRWHESDEREREDDGIVSAMQSAAAATLREETIIPDDSDRVLVLQSDADRRVLEQYLDERASDEGASRAATRALDPLYATVFDTESLSGTVSFDDGREPTFEVVDARDTGAYRIHDGRGLR